MFTEVLIHGSTPSRPDQIVSFAAYQAHHGHSNTRSRMQVLKSRDPMFRALHSFAVRDGELAFLYTTAMVQSLNVLQVSLLSGSACQLPYYANQHTPPLVLVYTTWWPTVQSSGPAGRSSPWRGPLSAPASLADWQAWLGTQPRYYSPKLRKVACFLRC